VPQKLVDQMEEGLMLEPSHPNRYILLEYSRKKIEGKQTLGSRQYN